MSEMMTTEIPVQGPAAPPPPPTRWGRLRSRFDSMTPRTRWLNLILIVLLILAIVLAFMLIGNPSTPTVAVRTVAVTRATVTSSVTGSGNAASSVSTPVSFQTSGTVTAVNVKPGDTVTLGEVLATVDPTSAKNTLRTAQDQLASAQAALAQAASGPTAVKAQQDAAAISQAQAAVTSANAGVTTAQNQLGLDQTATDSTISNAQTKFNDDKNSTDTSVQTAQATLQTDTNTQNGLVAAARQQLTSDTTTQNTAVQNAYTTCENTVAVPAPTKASCDSNPQVVAAKQTQTATLQKDQQALASAQNTRDGVLTKDQLAVTAAQQAQTSELNIDQQAITTAQQTQSATILRDNQSITTAKQSLTTEQGTVTNAQLAQQADLHPMTPDQINTYRESVNEAQVTVDNDQIAVTGTSLLSPQAGVVLAVSGKVGESSSGGSSGSTATTSTGSTGSTGSGAASAASSSATSAGSGFVTIANLSQLAVTANIAEADAAKIKLGQTATVAFPATNQTATGSVTQITPQSTVTNNVVLYPVQVSLNTAPPGVGVGSTASLTIAAASATDVLSAPNLAITSLGNRHTVTVRNNGTDTVVPVDIGLVGDTTTEITSGVQAGDVLVLPSSGGTTTGSTTPSGTNNGTGFPRTGG